MPPIRLTRNPVILAALLGILAVIIVLAILLPLREEDDSLAILMSAGILRVGMDASYPPFESIDPQTGKIVGLDVDLANRISEELGISAVIVNIAYDGLFDALLVGKVDVLISGLVDTPDLYAKATFSETYFNAGDVVVMRSENSGLTVEELEGRIIGVEYGSGGDVEARQWERRVANLTIERFNTSTDALSALSDYTIDAVFLDGISARLGLSQYPNLVLGPRLNDREFAIAFHPDAIALRTTVGRILHDLILNGEVEQLINKWFHAPLTIN